MQYPMVSRSLATNAQQIVNRRIRPTRVALVHGLSSAASRNEIHESLSSLFSPLNVQVLSVSELGEAGMTGLVSSQSYDLIGLLGEADEFPFPRKGPDFSFRLPGKGEHHPDGADAITLSFAPRTRFKDARKYLSFSDAVVLCDASGKNWPLEVSRIVYHFFESLTVPSMLNVDLADVKRIAKGIGLAFNLSDDSHKKIIAMLPKDCFVARSAIIHFSCRDDVLLREIYSIAKSIALKKGLARSDPQLTSHSGAGKIIRKVNVKMGIRILGDDPMESSGDNSPAFQGEIKRISMSAILFGI